MRRLFENLAFSSYPLDFSQTRSGRQIRLGLGLGHAWVTQARPKRHARETQASICESVLFATQVGKGRVGGTDRVIADIARDRVIGKAHHTTDDTDPESSIW